MARILGISAFYHDSAAALVVDGRVVAAAQEERFSRRKHDAEFPARAVAYCLGEAGLSKDDLDYVAFYEKPLVKFERLIETYLSNVPRGFLSFRRAIPAWMRGKIHQRRRLEKELGRPAKARLVFTDHHESHAASAFFPSPFAEAAILTMDGVGEWTTTAWGVGEGNRIRLEGHLKFPHSLGLLYSAFTSYCGFRVNSGEYKLMGLAPYGRPVYAEMILRYLLDLREDGSFQLDTRYFQFETGLRMTSSAFHRLFGGPPRTPESRIEVRHLDLAASIQSVTEEVVLRLARHVHRESGKSNLVLAGGVALNCVANGRLRREGPFQGIWVQPAAGDAGGALGAALFVHHQLLESPRSAQPEDSQQGSLLGPAFGAGTIREALREAGLVGEFLEDPEALWSRMVSALKTGKVVGWFQGRMEYGPRALGARSILADARVSDMQSTLNRRIKFREGFRPFAPIVLRERAAEIFDMQPGEESPYMLLVAPIREAHRRALSAEEAQTMREDPDLVRRVGVVRSAYPAVTHVDYSARVQTVDLVRHPRLYAMMRRFESETGSPVLVNTSFNVRGEPIVCTPAEAVRCFLATEMDALAIGDFWVTRDGVAASEHQRMQRQHLDSIPPD